MLCRSHLFVHFTSNRDARKPLFLHESSATDGISKCHFGFNYKMSHIVGVGQLSTFKKCLNFLLTNLVKVVSISLMPPVDHLLLVLSHAHVVFAVCAFPYILAFTTDSIEIRLVVNGNLVYTAVVPELQLAASRVSMIDS